MNLFLEIWSKKTRHKKSRTGVNKGIQEKCKEYTEKGFKKYLKRWLTNIRKLTCIGSVREDKS
jgi:hypothetical protein